MQQAMASFSRSRSMSALSSGSYFSVISTARFGIADHVLHAFDGGANESLHRIGMSLRKAREAATPLP